MRKLVPVLEVSAAQRNELDLLARSHTAPHRQVLRAKALLMAADGLANTAIASALSIAPGSVTNWPS
jgi:DNA-binding NarL/FixJ family response regulator